MEALLAGSLDATYGTGGLAMPALGPSGEAAKAMLLQPDGSAVVAGNLGGDDSMDAAIARLAADGSPDTSFSSDGIAGFPIQSGASEIANAVARKSTGEYIIAGESGQLGFVARSTQTGALDSGGANSFGEGIKPGYVLTSIPGAEWTHLNGVAAQSDDKIVVAGYIDKTGNADNELVVIRYTAEGALDTNFAGTGYSLLLPDGFGHTEGNAVAIQPDGKIVVAGYATGLDGFSDMLVVRYEIDGTLDTSFGGVGYVRLDADGSTNVTSDRANALALQPDGKIVLAGWRTRTSPGDPGDAVVARLNTDGTPDESFGSSGFKVSAAPAGQRLIARSVALQSDGDIIVAGQYDVSDGDSDPHPFLMRFTSATAPTAHPWYNAAKPLDVDSNGEVSPLDALMVINYLNSGFPVIIPPTSSPGGGPGFLDTSRNNQVEPLDALLVINALNTGQAGEGVQTDVGERDLESLLAILAQEITEQDTRKRHPS
jgi:uncharacterized delta-60 repeat protein